MVHRLCCFFISQKIATSLLDVVQDDKSKKTEEILNPAMIFFRGVQLEVVTCFEYPVSVAGAL